MLYSTTFAAGVRSGEMESLDFRVEAKMSVEEIAYAVREACLSEKLESVSTCAYINLTTKEDNKFTIRLSPRGFEVSLVTLTLIRYSW